ncbi:MAG: hypothetical protein M1829_002671 [Trizodia sp. TS-e1964]|nr:MAG: hypothetical protein M1829_002671 [Trizodia sp. TS-e1964]
MRALLLLFTLVALSPGSALPSNPTPSSSDPYDASLPPYTSSARPIPKPYAPLLFPLPASAYPPLCSGLLTVSLPTYNPLSRGCLSPLGLFSARDCGAFDVLVPLGLAAASDGAFPPSRSL